MMAPRFLDEKPPMTIRELLAGYVTLHQVLCNNFVDDKFELVFNDRAQFYNLTMLIRSAPDYMEHQIVTWSWKIKIDNWLVLKYKEHKDA